MIDCAKVHDEEGILGCGHHSRERGILLNVYTSCQGNGEATILAYVNDAMICESDGVFHGCKKLPTGQETTRGSFHRIFCETLPQETCEYTNPSKTWVKMFSPKSKFVVFLFRGKENGEPAWWYVSLEESKAQELKNSEKGCSTINLLDYGRILQSGWGQNPPKEISEKFESGY